MSHSIPKNPSTSGFDQQEFDQFRRFLEDACGISLAENKQYLVTNRMRKLLEDNNLQSFGDLVQKLKSGASRHLKDLVIDAMTTNETFWFRDAYPYDHLRDVHFPQMMGVANKMQGNLRIWCAACSTGQEPFSISMMAEEFKLKNMGALPRQIQIVATDLSATVLEQARKGEYDHLAVGRGLTQDRLDKYFDKAPNQIWRIKSSVRERIEFKPLNLVDSYAGLGKFDIIFCRNVLIYFNADLKRQILQKMHACLKPQGILYLGSSEGLAGAADLFDMVRCDPGIYYRAL